MTHTNLVYKSLVALWKNVSVHAKDVVIDEETPDEEESEDEEEAKDEDLSR